MFCASECVPFVKTGGLADVVGSLPQALSRLGEEVSVVIPLYREISSVWRDKMEHLFYFYINLGWRRQYCGVEKLEQDGVTYFFIDNEYYFHRPYVYGMGGDEGERFAFYSRAVLEMLPMIDLIPDVLHLNDWQTGLIPALLKSQYKNLPLYKDIKTVFTIHNLQYQGIFPISYIEDLLSLGNWAYTVEGLEFFGQCSYMKGGLSFSDYITTVSPTYAEEIKTSFYGERLDGLLRSREDRLTGILNGIDIVEYDPANDAHIKAAYTAENFRVKKGVNKYELQKRMGLEQDKKLPLIGMVTRLSSQKGLDLVERVLDEIMGLGVQMAVLGVGEDRYTDMLNWAQWKYAGRLAVQIEMNNELAHMIYAASDMFLMPSRFEPCGLSQMISLRYGTLPIVRETGGLKDTVLSYNEYTGEGNGFTFSNYNAHDMLGTIERAVGMYTGDRDTWKRLVARGMAGDYSWEGSAKKYIEVYRAVLAG